MRSISHLFSCKSSPPLPTSRFQVSSRLFGKTCFTHWNNVIKNAICLAIYLSLQNLISINPCIIDLLHTSIEERIVADLAGQKWWYVFVIILLSMQVLIYWIKLLLFGLSLSPRSFSLLLFMTISSTRWGWREFDNTWSSTLN